MRVRFLRLADSAVIGFPFLPGQVVDVEPVTAEVWAALRSGAAEELRAATEEVATMAAGTAPEPRLSARRRR
jgi:hypothetical protein